MKNKLLFASFAQPSIFTKLIIAAMMSWLVSCHAVVSSTTPMLTSTSQPIATTILLSPTVVPTSSVFVGRFTSAFEVSVFYPCNLKVDEEYVKGFGYRSLGYWIKALPESGFYEQFEPFLSQAILATGNERPEVTVFVRFVGVLSPTKSNLEKGSGYGHMGMYTNEVTAIKVLEMKPLSDDQCQK
ncbi:MAG: hypothetical protein U0Z26_17140 [Anaerolineales bacterium]